MDVSCCVSAGAESKIMSVALVAPTPTQTGQMKIGTVRPENHQISGARAEKQDNAQTWIVGSF